MTQMDRRQDDANEQALRNRILEIDDWRHHYELGEGLYTHLSEPWFRELDEWRLAVDSNPLEKILDGISGKRILDVGCNDGFWGFQFARRGAAAITGIDVRQDHVDRANLLRDYYKFGNASFYCYDTETMNMPRDLSGPFDLVLFYGLLYHLSDPVGTLRSVSAVTSKVIAVQTFITGSPQSVLALQHEDTQLPGSGVSPLVCRPSQSAVVKLLHSSGFPTVLRAWPYPHFLRPEVGFNSATNWAHFYGIKADEDERARIFSSLDVKETIDPKYESTQIILVDENTPPFQLQPHSSTANSSSYRGSLRHLLKQSLPPFALSMIKRVVNGPGTASGPSGD